MRALFCIIVLLISLALFCCAEQIPSGSADRPFDPSKDFIDRTDLARLMTCMGPCLQKSPGVLEFVTQRATSFPGLQVMFIGESPVMYFYGEDSSLVKTVDISTFSAKQIEQLLIDNGVTPK